MRRSFGIELASTLSDGVHRAGVWLEQHRVLVILNCIVAIVSGLVWAARLWFLISGST